MFFIPMFILSTTISNIMAANDNDINNSILNFRAPYYTNKIGGVQIGTFLAQILYACFPMFITLFIYILENFIFRRYRNRAALSITTIIILEGLLTLFEAEFRILKIIHMSLIWMITVMMFIMWLMLSCISYGRVVNDNKTRTYSRRDIAVLVMLISLLPVIVGFAGYAYASNLRTFKVFKKGQYPYAIVYENENTYYCLRCKYKFFKTGEEWYAPELEVLYLISDYELVVEKNGIVTETENYDIVNLVDKYF